MGRPTSTTASAGDARLPLAWLGPLLEASGYADEARAFLLALERAGHEVSAHAADALAVPAGVSGAQLDAVRRACARPLPGGEAVLVHHFPGGGVPRNGTGPSVARTMFESDRLPHRWQAQLLAFDEVWVPTRFNVETFTRGGLPRDRIHVLPETLDFELFAPGTDPLPETRLRLPRGFAFLTSFDFTDRKGWDVLLDAWAAAFAPGEDVCLVLKCLGLHVPDAEIRSRIDARLGGRETAPVVLLTEVLPLADLPRLYASVDAFVLASRGEGWGRPFMEAMAMGLPTIGTRWSGNLAFMHDRNTWLVDGTLVPVPETAQAHTDLYRGHRWYEPDREALAAALRDVYERRDEAAAKAATGRPELLERFGPDVVAERLAELTRGALLRWRDRRSLTAAGVFRGDFGSCHSLAVVNEALTGALERAGHGVELLAPRSEPSRLELPGVAQQWPPSFEPPSAGPFVLYQPWELGAIPARWVEQIRRRVDEVWVPSEPARAAFVDSGVAAPLVRVVPNGVDLERFTPQGPARELPARAGCVFLFVGGTIHRKGPDVLLDAYASAFSADDDVLLVVKSFGVGTVYRGMSANELVDRLRATPSAPGVVLLDDDVAFEELPSLYRAADVVVQPYRAEGFCLPALEALACGRPVAVTAGGPTDAFVSDACAWRIPSRRVPVPPGALPPELDLDGRGFLLEPDPTALSSILREAADPEMRAAKARAARRHAERFGWDVAARIASDRLTALAGRRPVRTIGAADVPDRRSLLLAAIPCWEEPETWAPAVLAYASAFAREDDTTLALPAVDPGAAAAHVERELRAAGVDPAALADIVLVDGLDEDALALELAADAVIVPNGREPSRAARVLPADPRALRALAGADSARPLSGAR